METIQSAMKTAFSTVQTDVTSMITASAPYALAIIGTVLAVTIGIKVFKKLTAQAQYLLEYSYHHNKGKGFDALTLICISKRKFRFSDQTLQL